MDLVCVRELLQIHRPMEYLVRLEEVPEQVEPAVQLGFLVEQLEE